MCLRSTELAKHDPASPFAQFDEIHPTVPNWREEWLKYVKFVSGNMPWGVNWIPFEMRAFSHQHHLPKLLSLGK